MNELYGEFLTQMESGQYLDGRLSLESSPSSNLPDNSLEAKSDNDSDHTPHNIGLMDSFRSTSILGPNKLLHPGKFHDNPSAFLYQQLQKTTPQIHHQSYPEIPPKSHGSDPCDSYGVIANPELLFEPPHCCRSPAHRHSSGYADFSHYAYDEDDDDDNDNDNDYFGSHSLLFSNTNPDPILTSNSDLPANPIVPGLFPQMQINDDLQFMKFDTLPLTPSYVSK